MVTRPRLQLPRAVLLVALAGAGCREGRLPALEAGSPQLAAPPAPSAASPPPSWLGAARDGDPGAVARAIDALPGGERGQPAVRFARARAALDLGDRGAAREALRGLDGELPLLAPELAELRGRLALAEGRGADAAPLLEQARDPSLRLAAARAHRDAGAPARARELLRELLARGGDLGPALLAETCVLSAELARAAGDTVRARADLARAAVEGAGTPEGEQAFLALGAGPGAAPIDPELRLRRARRLAELGRLPEALAEHAAVAAQRPPPLSGARLVEAEAELRFAARDELARAVELYDRAARLDPAAAPRLGLAAVRALTRAHRLADAAARAEQLARRGTDDAVTVEARHLAARLLLQLGRYPEARAAYRALTSPARGRPAPSAVIRYEAALATLLAGDAAAAAGLLGGLRDAGDEPHQRALVDLLHAVAEEGRGDRDRAVAELGALAESAPLSFGALGARARLARLGVEPPRPAPPAEARPLGVSLTPRVEALTAVGLVAEAAAELTRDARSIEARYSPRGKEALCEAYGRVGAAAERYRVGLAAVRREALARAPTAESRWAWDCVYPEPSLEMVRALEERLRLPEGLVHAVMRQESGFRRDVVSPANAVGLLQLLPRTAERVARESGTEIAPELLRIPARNLPLGAAYLARLLERFGDRVVLAAAAYNAGPGAVSVWLETGEGLPADLWVARIPFAETRGYVLRVSANLARYAYLRGGPAAIPALELELPRGLRALPGDY